MFPALEKIKDAEDFVRHLRLILEAQEPIRAKAMSFDSLSGKSDKLAAQALAALQVQIFTDLATEIRRMMRPFIKMNRAVYSTLDDDLDDAGATAEMLEALKGGARSALVVETKFPNLDAMGNLLDFTYHLGGLIDAIDDVRDDALAFDAEFDQDTEKASDALSSLKIQLFVHLVYHLTNLCGPFIRLNREIYARLADSSLGTVSG
jgi:hypothetical protein